MKTLLDDPFIAARIDAAVAPYVGKLSPDEIAWMREQLAETIARDARAQELCRRARPIDVDESGEIKRDAVGVMIPESASPKRAGEKGG